MKTNYKKFYLMLALSFVAMYGTMYLNTYSMDHIFFSTTRFYMSCLGISVMGVIMLLVMKGMYTIRKNNIGILIGCGMLFTIALTLVRVQSPIIR